MKKFKMLTALVLALALVFTAIPMNADAAAKKTTTVSTEAQLNKALASGKYSKIIFKSDAKGTVNIKAGDFKKITLVIDAPNAKISNNAVTKKIAVYAAKKVAEKAAGNKYTVKDKGLTMVVAKGAEVNSIKTAVTDGKLVLTNKGAIGTVAAGKTGILKITDNGSLEKVALKAKVALTIKGSSDEVTDIVVAKAAEGSSIAASTSVKVEAAANADITFNKGAEQSEVVATATTATVAVDNNTKADIAVTAADGTKDTVAAGEETKDATKTETAKDETKTDDSKKDETAKDDTKKDETASSSGTGASTGSTETKTEDTKKDETAKDETKTNTDNSGSSVVTTTTQTTIQTTTYTVKYSVSGATGSAVSVKVSNNGTDVKNGDKVVAGSTLKVQPSSVSGYSVKAVTNNGENVTDSNGTYTILNVSKDVTIVVTYEPNNAGGSGSGAGNLGTIDLSVNVESINVTATVPSGSSIVNGYLTTSGASITYSANLAGINGVGLSNNVITLTKNTFATSETEGALITYSIQSDDASAVSDDSSFIVKLNEKLVIGEATITITASKNSVVTQKTVVISITNGN